MSQNTLDVIYEVIRISQGPWLRSEIIEWKSLHMYNLIMSVQACDVRHVM